MNEKELSLSDMHYLISIYRLKQYSGYVRVTDVARDLHVAKPSVTRAVRKLSECGFVEKDCFGMLCLTVYGFKAVGRISEKETVVKTLLDRISGAGYKCSDEELLRIACAVSDQTFNIIKTAQTI